MPFSGHPYRKLEAEEVNPFANLLQNALGNYQNLLKTAYMPASLSEELKKAQLYNKYYGPNIESQIGLRGAQAGHLGAETRGLNIQNQFLPEKLRQLQNLRSFKESHPYMNLPGNAGQIASLLAMANDPTMAKQFEKLEISPSGSTAQQSQSSAMNFLSPMEPKNYVEMLPPQDQTQQKPQLTPFHQFMQESIKNLIKGKNEYVTTKPGIFDRMPVNEKENIIALGQGMGLDQLAMRDFINQGKSLDEIAQMQGFNSSDDVTPKYTLTRKESEAQKARNIAQRESDLISQYVEKYESPYASSESRYLELPLTIAKKTATGESLDEEAKFFVARMLQSENVPQRIAAMGGKPTVHAIRNLEEVSFNKLGVLSGLMTDRLYSSIQKEFSKQINKITDKAYQGYGRKSIIGSDKKIESKNKTESKNKFEMPDSFESKKAFQDWYSKLNSEQKLLAMKKYGG